MISFIQSELSSKEVQNIIGLYLHQIDFPKRWILLTDYCLDAPGKSNVISFVLLYYKNEREHAVLEQLFCFSLRSVCICLSLLFYNEVQDYLRFLFSYFYVTKKSNMASYRQKNDKKA